MIVWTSTKGMSFWEGHYKPSEAQKISYIFLRLQINWTFLCNSKENNFK